MKLVEDWRKAWRWFSVQIPAINAAFLATWGMLPSKFQDAFPIPWVVGTAFTLVVVGVVGRMIDQTPKDAP